MKKTDFDPRNADSDDEIEILEIVGLDEDSPAAEPLADPADESGNEARDEVLVELEDESGETVSALSEDEADDDERLLRLTADFENFQRRVEREREAHRIYASVRLIERLLPVLDNFERALDAARQAGGDDGFHNGIALIFRQLLDELRKEGLTAVDAVGEPFDPAVHEAVVTDTDASFPPNTVVEELQRGYLLHDRLLRPALVRVNVDPASAVDQSRRSGEG